MEIVSLLASAAALLFCMIKFKKASFKGSNWIALAMGAVAGLAILGTGFPGWISGLIGPFNIVLGSALLVVGVVLGVDLADRKPHTPALICAVLAPTLFAFGAASVDQIPQLVGSGAQRVESSFGDVG